MERKSVIDIIKTYGIMSLQFQTQWVLLLLISSFSNFQNNLPKIPWKNDWLQIQKRKQLWPKPAHKKALDSDLMLGLFVYVSGMLGNRGTRYKVPFKWRNLSQTGKIGSGKNTKKNFLLGLKYILSTCFESKNFSSNSCPELSNQQLSFSACQIY